MRWSRPVCFLSKVLVDRPSVWNKRVTVVETLSGLRYLRFGAVEDCDDQSLFDVRNPGRLHLPYVKSMCEILAGMPVPDKVLMIGLGGGTIASFLRQLHPRTRIDIVEVDPVVIEVACEWMGFQPDPSMQVACGDGRDWIESSVRRGFFYNLVVLDAFGPDAIPQRLSTIEFLSSVLKVLVPNSGTVAANLFGTEACSRYPAMLATFRAVFDKVSVQAVPMSGNRLLFAQAVPSVHPPLEDAHLVLSDRHLLK